MRFLVDACLNMHLAAWLRERGHDAVHVRDEGLQRLPDGAIFRKGADEDRIVITLDLDFGEIARMSQSNRIGVILFRLRNARTSHVVARLEQVLASSSRDLLEGCLIVVEDGRHRVRKFPA